ncbi:hypothetical protein ACI796_13240 [Geodermatophilus sp. SYSU D00525]
MSRSTARNSPSAMSTAVTTSRCAGHSGEPIRAPITARRSASGMVCARSASAPIRARASCSPVAPASAAATEAKKAAPSNATARSVAGTGPSCAAYSSSRS